MAQVLFLAESHPDNWDHFESWLRSIQLESGSAPTPREVRLYEALVDESEIDEFVSHLKRNEYNERVSMKWVRKLLSWLGAPVKFIDTSNIPNKHPRKKKRRGTGEPGHKVVVLGYIEDRKNEKGEDML